MTVNYRFIFRRVSCFPTELISMRTGKYYLTLYFLLRFIVAENRICNRRYAFFTKRSVIHIKEHVK